MSSDEGSCSKVDRVENIKSVFIVITKNAASSMPFKTFVRKIDAERCAYALKVSKQFKDVEVLQIALSYDFNYSCSNCGEEYVDQCSYFIQHSMCVNCYAQESERNGRRNQQQC